MKPILILLLCLSMACAKERIAPEMEEPEPKSLGKAYAWVFGTAAAPLLIPLLLLGRDTQSDSYGTIHALGFVVIPIGWSVAPSMGRFYAGDYRGGWSGMGLRFGALAAFGAAALPCMFSRCNAALIAVPLAATGVWMGSVAYDTFWGTPRSVRKHNATIGVSPYIPRLGSTGVLAHMEF